MSTLPKEGKDLGVSTRLLCKKSFLITTWKNFLGPLLFLLIIGNLSPNPFFLCVEGVGPKYLLCSGKRARCAEERSDVRDAPVGPRRGVSGAQRWCPSTSCVRLRLSDLVVGFVVEYSVTFGPVDCPVGSYLLTDLFGSRKVLQGRSLLICRSLHVPTICLYVYLSVSLYLSLSLHLYPFLLLCPLSTYVFNSAYYLPTHLPVYLSTIYLSVLPLTNPLLVYSPAISLHLSVYCLYLSNYVCPLSTID